MINDRLRQSHSKFQKNLRPKSQSRNGDSSFLDRTQNGSKIFSRSIKVESVLRSQTLVPPLNLAAIRKDHSSLRQSQHHSDENYLTLGQQKQTDIIKQKQDKYMAKRHSRQTLKPKLDASSSQQFADETIQLLNVSSLSMDLKTANQNNPVAMIDESGGFQLNQPLVGKSRLDLDHHMSSVPSLKMEQP